MHEPGLTFYVLGLPLNTEEMGHKAGPLWRDVNESEVRGNGDRCAMQMILSFDTDGLICLMPGCHRILALSVDIPISVLAQGLL